jgi:hypothetical protein
MYADVHDRLRALAEQLDRDIPHVSTDEVLERVGGVAIATHPGDRHETDGWAGPTSRRARPWLTAVAAGLIVLLIGGLLVTDRRDGGGPSASPTSNPSSEAVVMPDLIGTTSEEAINQLDELGLVVVILQSDDPDGTFDTVVATDPVAGTGLAAGAAVHITVGYPPGQGGPLDFATTDEPLPIWPHMSVSEPAATTSGYGLAFCSGVATMRAAVDSSSGPEHSYYGTMCSFITLDEPRPSTVVSCATITDGTDYARCRRLSDQTENGPGMNRPTTAKGDEADRLDMLPTPTGWDEPATFGTTVSAAANSATQIDYEDERVTVTIVAGDDNTPVKTTIRLPGAVVEATAGPQIIQSGLAYAAYQDRSGAIDIVGIVPDDVTEVEIAGTVVPVANNVWHYASTTNQPLDFVVRSAEGKSAST